MEPIAFNSPSWPNADSGHPSLIPCLLIFPGHPGEDAGAGARGQNDGVPEAAGPGGDQVPPGRHLPQPGAADRRGEAVRAGEGGPADPAAQGLLGGGRGLRQG